MTEIERIKNRFLSDFGVHDILTIRHTPPITVNGSKWVFGLRKIDRPKDTVWISMHTDFSLGSTVGDKIANDFLLTKTSVALSVCSINNIPLFKMMGVKISDEQMSDITDINNPPDSIKFATAKLFLDTIGDMEEGSSIVTFLKDQYTALFPDNIQFGEIQKGPENIKFKCPDCHYITVVPYDDMARLSNVIKEKGGLSCLSCGALSKVEEETDPLDLPGSES